MNWLKKRKELILKYFWRNINDTYDERINKINNSNINNKKEELVNFWYEAEDLRIIVKKYRNLDWKYFSGHTNYFQIIW